MCYSVPYHEGFARGMRDTITIDTEEFLDPPTQEVTIEEWGPGVGRLCLDTCTCNTYYGASFMLKLTAL